MIGVRLWRGASRRQQIVAAAALAVVLAAGTLAAVAAWRDTGGDDSAWRTGADPNSAPSDGVPSDGAGDGAPADGAVPAGDAGSALTADPESVSREALTGGQETAELPGHFPDEIPVPARAALLEASYPPGSEPDEYHLYLRAPGQLEDAVRTLAGEFGDAGFDPPHVQLADTTGQLSTQGHGYQVAVESRVSDDHPAVLDMTYRVSASE